MRLRGKAAHLKLISTPNPLAVTVHHVESSGVWIAGTPITELVVQAGAQPAKDVVVFVPFQNVEWLVAEKEPGL